MIKFIPDFMPCVDMPCMAALLALGIWILWVRIYAR